MLRKFLQEKKPYRDMSLALPFIETIPPSECAFFNERLKLMSNLFPNTFRDTHEILEEFVFPFYRLWNRTRAAKSVSIIRINSRCCINFGFVFSCKVLVFCASYNLQHFQLVTNFNTRGIIVFFGAVTANFWQAVAVNIFLVENKYSSISNHT